MKYAVVLATVISGASFSVAAADFTVTSNRFCIDVQAVMEATTVEAGTVIHPTYESFKESKAEAQPLRTEQYVRYADEAAKKNPIQISCKTKTADLLKELYGEDAAKTSGTCRGIHQAMLDDVAAGMSPDEKAALKYSPADVVLEDDEVVFMGSQWVEPFANASIGDDGRLHLKSKALLVEWTNVLFKLAPDRLRGTHYCHLIAPEYLRGLMQGTAQVELVAN